MMELDNDRGGSIDIDEFVQMMTGNDDFDFKDSNNKDTHEQMKAFRQLKNADFLSAIMQGNGASGAMPVAFTQSFYKKHWKDTRMNLPSDGL